MRREGRIWGRRVGEMGGVMKRVAGYRGEEERW